MYLCPDPISEKHMLNEKRRLHNKYFVYMYLCPDPISEKHMLNIALSTCIYALTPYLRSVYEKRRLHNKSDALTPYLKMLNEKRRLHNKYFVYMYLCPDPISEKRI